MKKMYKTLILTFSISTMISMQALAIGNYEENIVNTFNISSNSNAKAKMYIEKISTLRSEIDSYTLQIKEIKDYNISISQKLKTISDKYKSDKNSFSSEKMKQIKELRKSIKSDDKKENTINENDSVKSLINNKEYDKAIARLNEILEAKKEQLKVLQERNAIWHQIDAIIG